MMFLERIQEIYLSDPGMHRPLVAAYHAGDLATINQYYRLYHEYFPDEATLVKAYFDLPHWVLAGQPSLDSAARRRHLLHAVINHPADDKIWQLFWELAVYFTASISAAGPDRLQAARHSLLASVAVYRSAPSTGHLLAATTAGSNLGIYADWRFRRHIIRVTGQPHARPLVQLKRWYPRAVDLNEFIGQHLIVNTGSYSPDTGRPGSRLVHNLHAILTGLRG